MAPDGITEFNAKVIAEFRANQGRVGGILAGTSMILIHHIGAKSGIERVTPLAFTSQEDGSYLIVASNGGSATHNRGACHTLASIYPAAPKGRWPYRLPS